MSAPVTHYDSASRVPVEIATMNFHHASAAHAKLAREHGDPAVIAALADHLAAIEATFEKEPKL